MKKKLESELVSIAHRILKLKGKEDVSKMYAEVSKLYEKLAVLKFVQDNFNDNIPTIENDSSFFEMLDTAFNNKVSDTIEVEDKVYVNLDAGKQEDIVEPVMEKIKNMVAQMPKETQSINVDIENNASHQTSNTLTFESINSDFGKIPEFEPIEMAEKRDLAEVKKSLNDKLKSGGLQVGLNDKLAFIKHLFEGRNEDYDRVISQINTTSSLQEAQNFIYQFVKPDYNNWLGKEDYEARFIELVEGKFL